MKLKRYLVGPMYVYLAFVVLAIWAYGSYVDVTSNQYNLKMGNQLENYFAQFFAINTFLVVSLALFIFWLRSDSAKTFARRARIFLWVDLAIIAISALQVVFLTAWTGTSAWDCTGSDCVWYILSNRVTNEIDLANSAIWLVVVLGTYWWMRRHSTTPLSKSKP